MFSNPRNQTEKGRLRYLAAIFLMVSQKYEYLGWLPTLGTFILVGAANIRNIQCWKKLKNLATGQTSVLSANFLFKF